MMLGIVFLGVPLALLFGPLFVPDGSAARILYVGLAVLVLVLLASWFFSLPPLFTGIDRADAFAVALLYLWSGAATLGGLGHYFLRGMVAGRPNAVRWLLVLALLFAIALVAMWLLGV